MIQQRTHADSVNNHSHRNSTGNPVELEVNVSIGQRKYVLEVQRCEDLHESVHRFLTQNCLNARYMSLILSLVREELEKRNRSTHLVSPKMDELMKIKAEIEDKKKSNVSSTKTKTQANDHSYRSNAVASNKQNNQGNYNSEQYKKSDSEKEIKAAQVQNEETKCQNVYEKWKVKQRMKEQLKNKNSTTPSKAARGPAADKSGKKNQNQNRQKSRSQKKLTEHTPDHFYRKGIKFNYAKQVHANQMYKQKYPFQMHPQQTLTPKKKNELHERLYKEQKFKETQKIQKNIQERLAEKAKSPIDKYKQKVWERDNKINQTLNFLIQNKMIENPQKVKVVSKSPFRRTNCY